MKHQIRKSDDGSFYYLLSIDSEGNEAVLIESSDLNEVKNHKDIKGKEVEVVDEKDTRGSVS